MEGRQAVRELLVAGRRPVHELLVARDAASSPVLDEIVAAARHHEVRLRVVAAAEIAALARSEVPQGVLARTDPLVPADLEDLIGTGGAHRPFLVVLDGVTDPHNLGSVLRSALSAGATGAVIASHRAAHVTPTVAKAAAGAIEYLPIALVGGIPAALERCRRSGVWIVGLDASGRRDLDDLAIATEPLALVLGDEGRGLASLVRRRCDELARIPLSGPIASLNVSAAAAVACFAIARRRASPR